MIQPDREDIQVYEHPSGDGFVKWRRGTADNVELLDIEVSASARRQGVGRELVRGMLRRLRSDPPATSVYGFTRVTNRIAHDFYRALGFDLSYVAGVYEEGGAVVFSAQYDDLVARHL